MTSGAGVSSIEKMGRYNDLMILRHPVRGMTEGVDVSVLVRYTGRREATVARWLARAGQHSERWHRVLFVGLSLTLVQMDELYVHVRGTGEQCWLWLAMDPSSKAIPSLHLGGRKAEDA